MKTEHRGKRATTQSVTESRQLGAFFRRGLSLGKWIVPGTVLALLPKCPVCLAGNIAVWTGLGLSFAAASDLRRFIIGVCVTALTCLVARRAWHFHRLAQNLGKENR